MAVLSTGKIGFLVAAGGVAHFVAPEAFEDITRKAFPVDTQNWVLRNGAAETAIGLTMMVPFARKLGLAALLAYTGWLGYHAANAQT